MWWAAGLAGLVLLIAGCSSTPAPTLSPAPTSTATAAPPATPRPPTMTPEPTPHPQELVMCGSEPPFASPFTPTDNGDDLLALFYEEPVERVGYRWEPRLVERVPSLENGDVITSLVQVPPGSRYVDDVGVLRFNDEELPLRLPQLVVTFTLKSGLLWSDGDALTTEDVVLGYYLAQSAETYGRWRDVAERTERFTALDDYTVRWEGVPGYVTTEYPGFLFPPQPAHRWTGQTLRQILEDRTPPATGPFRVVAWEAGREVRLEPNPNYAGAAPVLEKVTLRFPATAIDTWGELLINGQCDLLLPDPVMMTEWRQWLALLQRQQAMIWADVAPVVLRLDFNLDPLGGETSPLVDPRVRRGLAQCIDRTKLSEALPGQAFVPAGGFIPPGHPAYRPEMAMLGAYDPQAGRSLLEEAGWRDEDGDGVREAYDVEGFSDGEPLSLTLHMAPQYLVTSAHVVAGLENCGVGVLPLPTEQQLLYATDAVSPLAGRTYQMALFGWRAELPQFCGVWRSNRIPAAETQWMGENFSGYASEAYDAACQRALTAVDLATQDAALQAAESLLVEDLPTLFLTWRPFWFVARAQVRGLRPDTSAFATIWNIEEVYIAADN